MGGSLVGRQCVGSACLFGMVENADCGLRTADCGLRIAIEDCGLRIVDCGKNKAKYHVHNFILTTFQHKFQFFNSKYVFQTQNEVPILINFMNMKMRTAECGKDRVRVAPGQNLNSMDITIYLKGKIGKDNLQLITPYYT